MAAVYCLIKTESLSDDGGLQVRAWREVLSISLVVGLLYWWLVTETLPLGPDLGPEMNKTLRETKNACKMHFGH